jgi:hypothetical protein
MQNLTIMDDNLTKYNNIIKIVWRLLNTGYDVFNINTVRECTNISFRDFYIEFSTDCATLIFKDDFDFNEMTFVRTVFIDELNRIK